MATTKPRISITLSAKTHRILKAISQSSGQPMSVFVSEILEGASPTLERMAATFQKIKTAQDAELQRFHSGLDEAQHAFEPAVMEVVGQFDLFLGNIDKLIDDRAAATASPPTNRGVTPIRATQPKGRNGKGLTVVQKKQVLKKTSVSEQHKPGAKNHEV
jgi:predicted DNA-binding protein